MVFVHQIARLISGVTYNKLVAKNEPRLGYLPLLRANNISNIINFDELVYVPVNLIKDDQLIQEGDVIIAMSSGSKRLVGKSSRATIDFEGSFGAFCSTLRSSKLISNKFVAYSLKTNDYKRYIEKVSKGTNINNLKRDHLLHFRIPFPPLAEQHRIVNKIEYLFTIIEKGEEYLRNAHYQLKLYRESILQKAFTGQLTEQWRIEHQPEPATAIVKLLKDYRQKYYKGLINNWEEAVSQWEEDGRVDRKPTKPRALKNFSSFTEKQIDELPELPNTWAWIKLGQISEIVGGVTKGRKLSGKKTVITPYLRVANVQDGYLDLIDIKEIEVLPEDVTKYQLEAGDVLYIEGGDKDKLGRGTVWKNELPICIHQNHVFRARMINRKINFPEFIAYNSQTQVAKGYFFNNAKQTVNLASINMTVLSELPVPLCSMEEQQEILDQLEKLFTKQDELNQTINSALRDAQNLRQSILKKAFEGKLVPQDLNDEPASELLKKIQKEKQEWQEYQEAKKKISKPKTRMEALTIEQVLKQAKEPISPKELWETSMHKNDIEEFYLELKKLGDKVVEIKSETESLLRLKDAN